MVRWVVLPVCALLGLGPAAAQRFAAPVLISTGNRPTALLAADFTGKGTPELLASDAREAAAASSVRVLTNSAGTFRAGPALATAGSAFLAFPSRPGQLPDLYWVSISGLQGTLYRARAQPDGTYLPGMALTPLPLSGPGPPRFLLAGGGTRGGFADTILVADAANAQLYTVYPNPDGTFAVEPVSGSGLPLLPEATQLLTSDLNGDGVPDLLVAGATGVQVFLARGGGNALFYGFSASVLYPYTGSARSIALADLDGDSHADLLVEGAGGRIDIYHGNADGTFATISEAGSGLDDAAAGSGGHLVGVADLNSDGLPDLVLANGKGITVLLGTGGRSFQLDSVYASGSTPTHFAFTDLNGDGKPDVAFDSAGGVTVLESTGLLPTATTITDLVSPIYYGQEIGYTNGIDAVVSATPADPAAPQPAGATLEGGLIYVYLDGQLACSLVVGATNPAGGPQRCNDANFQGFGAGYHLMVGAYQGNSFYAPSTSPTYTVQILPDDTQMQVVTSLTPAPPGTAVRFTATVTAPYATPTGAVQFFDGSALLGSGSLDATGATTFSVSTLSLGTHTITASYIPTPLPAQNPPRNFNPSQASLAQVIAVLSRTVLTSSTNPSLLEQPVTFTATVALAGASFAAAGNVVFYDGPTLLETVAVSPLGTAFYTTATLDAGSHPIRAVFTPGTANTIESSASLTQVVQPPVYGTDFDLVVDPAAIAIGVGNTGTVVVTVTEPVPLNERVSLSCSSLPWEATCSFAVASLPPGGGVTQLIIHPQAPHNCSDTRQYFIAGNTGRCALALVALAALLLRLRPRRYRMFIASAVLCALPWLAGCGLAGHCTDLGTRPGDYTFTVIAKSSGGLGVQHSQTVHLRAYLDGEPR